MEQGQNRQNDRNRGSGSKPHSNDSLSEFVFGKIQPQAIELEQAVLGALMLDREALSMVVEVLHAENFYTEAHRAIYSAIIRLFNKYEPIDLLTVTEEVKRPGNWTKLGADITW